MKYHQRDIVEVSFLFPDGTFKPHPAIIVSNDQLQEDEDGMFYLVLITSNDWLNPQYETSFIFTPSAPDFRTLLRAFLCRFP